MLTLENKQFRIRSFVGRNSRKTPAQIHALKQDWSSFGLNLENKVCDNLFDKVAPQFLEIGFGKGESLLALASANPDKNFLAVETHRPGIGALLLGIKKNKLSNIRIFANDVIDVLEKCIADLSLNGVQIFFPDPWPKRRHHARRLIQPSFVSLVVAKLKVGGSFHLATDWEDYAKQMMRVLSADDGLINLAGINQFATRSPYRPVITKFERRAIASGRLIWELQFRKE